MKEESIKSVCVTILCLAVLWAIVSLFELYGKIVMDREAQETRRWIGHAGWQICNTSV